jgi:site-specific recombinase XerD
MAQYSALRCVSGIWQNSEKPLISNGLRFIVTNLPTAALWVLFHLRRHTYATEITLSHGVPLETVSKMLGHSRISTTQIYAKVTDDKIDMDTRSLEEKIAGRFSVAI